MNNYIHLKGRLGKDAEHKVSSSGKNCATFSIAVYNGKDSQGENQYFWVDVLAVDYDRADCLKQGMTVSVDGKLSIDSYKNKNGNSRRNIQVITFGFDSITPEYAPQRNTAPQQRPQQYAPQRQQNNNNNGGFTGGPEDFCDDNIPF